MKNATRFVRVEFTHYFVILCFCRNGFLKNFVLVLYTLLLVTQIISTAQAVFKSTYILKPVTYQVLR